MRSKDAHKELDSANVLRESFKSLKSRPYLTSPKNLKLKGYIDLKIKIRLIHKERPHVYM